ncbi:Rho GTPase activation protein [Russula earlei]|uniref:Rho GTPase activation protein n=1 Tax=Russula earlei TaxID=71964 RepID=A0ACC0U311_9AGAM|nr:Rho GTPase activation protein [Russula earlei]
MRIRVRASCSSVLARTPPCAPRLSIILFTDIFGVPLNESVLRSPATAILGGYRHDLPLVVFLCVEELYRTGIYKSGLFRDLPNRQRHHELSSLFDLPPAFGEGMSLRAESTADICALLLTYLKELPEPVLTPYLFNAFWNWCVRPSAKREDERMQKEQDEEEDLRARFFQTGQRPPRPSRRVLFEKARLRAAQDEAAEMGQVAIARDLLRLLPTHSFSLIVYLCAFFTQDIGRIFGPAVFGGPVPAARRMMIWFLKRWNCVRMMLAASSAYSLPPRAKASAPSSQTQSRCDLYDPGCAAQEMAMARSGPPGWHGQTKAKGRECLGDSTSEVPRCDGQSQSTLKRRALLPPPVFAPTSTTRLPSIRSAGSQCNAGSIPNRGHDESEGRNVHAREDREQWRSTDVQLLIALSRLHDARARIDELEHAVVDAATQSERAREKLTYIATVTGNDVDSELKLTALERDEANELVQNVCAVLKGVVQQAVCAEAG